VPLGDPAANDSDAKLLLFHALGSLLFLELMKTMAAGPSTGHR
jgi:hypothetical protein